MTRPTVTYFSDILCIWGHIAQARLDELAEQFGDRIDIDERFVSVFPDARTKTAANWKDKGGYEAMNAMFQKMTQKFPHIEIHPDVWVKTQPRSSTAVHLFIKAIHLQDGNQGNYFNSLTIKAVRRFREAFFEQGRDIADWDVQMEVAAELGLDLGAIETSIKSGEAMASLDADHNLAAKLGVKGSPTYVMNNGRQILYGNVGYKLIEANVQELLRTPDADTASWC